jgi:hypothetical protein
MQNKPLESMAESGEITPRALQIPGDMFRKDRGAFTTQLMSITPLAPPTPPDIIPKDSLEAEIMSMLNKQTNKEEHFEKARHETMAALDQAIKRDSFISRHTKETPPLKPREIPFQDSVDELDVVCTDKDIPTLSLEKGSENFYNTGDGTSKDDKKGKSANYNKRNVEARAQKKRSSFHIPLSTYVKENHLDETAITAGKIGAANQKLFNLAAGGLSNMPNMPNSAWKVNNNLMEMDENSGQKANSSQFVET